MKMTFVYGGAVAVVATAAFFALNSSIYNNTGESALPATVTISQAPLPDELVPPVGAPSSALLPNFHYIEIIDGCGPYHDVGICVNMRSGPGVEFPVVTRLRTGIVFRVEENKAKALDGSEWYRVVFDKEIRHPDRVKGDWYIAVNPDAVRSFRNSGDSNVAVGRVASTTKRIVVNLTEEMLYAYDGDELFLKEPVSPGLELTPTPRGQFSVFYKTPSRYMQGPIEGISDQEYDLPGVPWNLYFTPEGAVIHGAYWHDHFGKRWSHGCVNLFPKNAEKLYLWADLGTPVTVKD